MARFREREPRGLDAVPRLPITTYVPVLAARHQPEREVVVRWLIAPSGDDLEFVAAPLTGPR